jgi:hypothetical protein
MLKIGIVGLGDNAQNLYLTNDKRIILPFVQQNQFIY